MITIKDIAKVAGVSYATVSRALNGRADVNKDTRERIVKLAEEMGYQPNAIARSLVNQRSNIIGLIVPDVSNSFFADVAQAVSDAADQAGFTTMICNTGWDPQKEQEKLKIMQEQRVAGIIIKPTGFYKLGTLAKVSVPVVVFWHPTEENVTFIEVDHSKGGRLAVLNLIERGYKRIGFIGGQETSPANQLRLLAYQQAMQEHDMRINPQWISFGGFSMISGYERITKMMRLKDRPDAVFCGNDTIAMGVLQYLKDNKIKVPEDFGLIGYDDLSFSGLPMLNMSSVRQPRDQMGLIALTTLVEQINKKEERPGNQRILIEPELIIRGT